MAMNADVVVVVVVVVVAMLPTGPCWVLWHSDRSVQGKGMEPLQ